ncbi:MAG: mannitol-/sugar-/sorbitol-6-phosphatase [Micromonosporaceae bacterium]
MGSSPAVLFDVDGVLLDTGDLFRRIWSGWAATRSLDPGWVVARTYGRRTADVLCEVAPHLDAVAESRALDALTRDRLGEVRPVPGARQLLRSCRRLPCAVVTSGSRWFVHECFRATRLPLPPVAVYGEEVQCGKPSPEGYLTAARRLGVAPHDCVVVEDAPEGVAAARAAGCTVLAVTTTHTAAELGAAHACLSRLPTVDSLVRMARSDGGRQRHG